MFTVNRFVEPRALVARLVARFVPLLGAVSFAACASASTHPITHPPTHPPTHLSTLESPRDLARERSESFRFDNQGRDRVDVYLVGEKRSWRIGRLEPGQARWLRVPRGVPPNDLARVQLVVLANAELTVTPMQSARAVTTIRQPFYVLSGQRWAFADGQLKALRTDGGARW